MLANSVQIHRRPSLVIAASIMTATAILGLDLISPLGIADGVLYVSLVLLGHLGGGRRLILMEAAAGTVLCVIGYFFSPAGGEMWMVLWNRFLSIFVVWITAVLCLRQQQAHERLQETQKVLEQRVRARTRELDEAFRQSIRERTYLQLNKDIAAAANTSRSVEEALQFSLEKICHHTGWPVGHVYLLRDKPEKRMVSSRVWHMDDPEPFQTLREITESTTFESGIGLPGRVMENGEPAWLTDATLDANFPRAKLVDNIGIRAGFGFPILVGKEVVGVMEFFSSDAVPPQREMLEVMAQTGVHLGRVMERKQNEAHRDQLLKILKERIKELTCLYQVSHVVGMPKSLDRIFVEAEAHILEGWENPEAVGARITFDGKTFGHLPPEAPYKLRAPLTAHGVERGCLEVGFAKEPAPGLHPDRGGPRDERNLIDTLAHLLDMAIERGIAEAAVQQSQEQLRTLYQHLQQVREEERTRMSREFHDHLGQMLTTLKLELSLLDRKLAKEGSGCRNHTGWLLDLVEGTLPAVKQLVMDLRPPVLDDLGLKEAIEWLCRDFEKRTGTVCSLNLDGGVEALDQDLNTALFRIFQETLTNVARHAEATHVEVLFEEREGQLVLEVNDNGKGIEPWKVSDLKSLGLLGMKERVLPWGGVVDVRGSAEKGTTVTIKIQMEKQ